MKLAALVIVVIVPFVVIAEPPPRIPIKIGVIQSLTGIGAQDGNTVVRAVQLAADDLRKQGAEISLTIEDDTTDPKSAVSAFRKLQSRGVDAIIGATWSFTTNAITPLAKNTGVVLFNSSTLPQVLNYREGGGFLFNNAIPMDAEIDPFRQYLTRSSIKSAVIFQNATSWGDVQSERYRELLKHSGIELLREYKGLEADGNRWDDVVPQLKALSPDIVILILGRLDIERILRRAREMQVSSRFFGSKNTIDAWELAGDKSVFTDALCFTYPLAQLRRGETFYARYRERFAEEAAIYADSSYDAVFILCDAIRRSRIEGRPLPQILQATEFSGVVGNYRYSEKNSLGSGSSSLVCFAQGRPELAD